MMTKMMTRFTEEAGLAERILVGVVAWALAAVVMLTSTLAAARRIDDRVAFIRGEVSVIDDDLTTVAILNDINDSAANILTAAEPLSGQLDQVLESTVSIDANAASILSTAGEINTTVGSINATAGEINSTVKTINSSARSINDSVRSIHGSVGEINQSVHGINGSFAGILGNVVEIRGDHGAVEGFGGGLAGAMRRVAHLTDLVTAIKGDTGNILALVGSIEASAKSIDSKPILP